jgi:hypothetical protein
MRQTFFTVDFIYVGHFQFVLVFVHPVTWPHHRLHRLTRTALGFSSSFSVGIASIFFVTNMAFLHHRLPSKCRWRWRNCRCNS